MDMGKVLLLFVEQLKMLLMIDCVLLFVLVFISDGQFIDDFDTGLRVLMNEFWGKKVVCIVIVVG